MGQWSQNVFDKMPGDTDFPRERHTDSLISV